MSDTFDHEGDAWNSLDGWGFGNNDYEPWHYRSSPRLPHCRKCGAICAWHLTGNGWRLYSDGGPHHCVAKVSDFDILED